MAEDFKIKITTTADTSGATQAAKSLGEVKGAAAATGTEGSPGIDLLSTRTLALAAAAGAAVTAIGAFQSEMRASIAVADRLDDAVNRFQGRVNGESLQGIGNVAGLNGSSVEGVAQSFNFLIKSSQAAIEGNKELTESYESLGVSIEDLRALTPDELFLRISDAVKDAKDPAAAYNNVLQVMGRSAGTLVATLSLGSEEIRKSGREIGVWADDTRRNLADAQDQLDILSNRFTIFAGETTSNVITAFRALSNAPAPTIAKLLTLWDVTGRSGPAVLRIAELTNQFEGLKDAAGPASDSVRKVVDAAGEIPDKELELKKQIQETATAADAAKAAIDRLTATADKLKSLQEQILSAKDAATKAGLDRQVEAGTLSKSDAEKQKLAIDINARDRADTAALTGIDTQISEAEKRKQAAEVKTGEAAKRFAGTLKLDDQGRAAIQELEAIKAEIETLKKIREGTATRQTIDRTAAIDGGQFRVGQAAAAAPDPTANPAQQAAVLSAPLAGRGTNTAEAARSLNTASRALLDGATPEEAATYEAAANNFLEFAKVSAETMAQFKVINEKVMAELATVKSQVANLNRN